MKWMRFRVRTTADAEDILISSMQDIGLCGAQIEDHVPLTAAEKEQMFVDIMPEEPADDGSAVLSFYVEETEDGKLRLEDGEKTPEEVCGEMENVIRELREYSDAIGDGTVTIEETEDIDWVNNWKQFFHQFWIDDVLVIPSWEKPVEADREPALTFHIDPGTAFGTGAHETTQLCIREIRKYLSENTEILDVGTGSGILGIVALKFGAKHVLGTDLDPCAVPAVAENKEANGPQPRKGVGRSTMKESTEDFDKAAMIAEKAKREGRDETQMKLMDEPLDHKNLGLMIRDIKINLKRG